MKDWRGLVQRWSSWRNVPVLIEEFDRALNQTYLIVFDWRLRLTFTEEETKKELEEPILNEEAGISGIESLEELDLLMESLGV